MSKIGNIVFATGTVAIALVTGYLMQSESSVRPATTQLASLDASMMVGGPVKSDTNAVVPSAGDTTLKRQLGASFDPAGQIIPADPSPAAKRIAGIGSDRTMLETILDKPNLFSAAQPPADMLGSFDMAATFSENPTAKTAPLQLANCKASVTADPTAAAMVQLKIDAPCNRAERLTVHHNGMMFSDMTDDTGRLSLKVPALSENALFMVSFATGQTLVAQTEVTSIGFYDRAVVQWRGNISLQIHAREFGADYGDDGHVWAEDAGSIQQAVTGERGFISHYGDRSLPEALFVEVYTFPSGTSKQAGDVLLSVEAEVSDSNCGRDIEAQSIQFSDHSDLRVQDLVLQMPACDEFGGYLVLNNLLEDLTIALR